MRLIDADKFEVVAFDNRTDEFAEGARAVLEMMDAAPTIDAVPVVRCRECKHFGGHGACHCNAADENGTPIFVRDDDFCSYGKRKDGDG